MYVIELIELTAGILAYMAGYVSYCEKNIAATALCALCSAFLLLRACRDIRMGRYLHMPMKKVDKLSGRAFEEYLSVQFKHLGYRVKSTGASYDFGADLILKKHGEKIVVQAKRYDRSVGISAVQEAAAAIAYYEADKAMVVSNRNFTKSARDLARQNEVELWGREEIEKKFHIREL